MKLKTLQSLNRVLSQWEADRSQPFETRDAIRQLQYDVLSEIRELTMNRAPIIEAVEVKGPNERTV
jgi:hypothetical protein